MMLSCDTIHFQYPGTTTQVFKDLNFQLKTTGFHALFGSSGVGKTTLARMISGQMQGYTGSIHTNGAARILFTYNLERLPGWSSVKDHLDRNTPPERRGLLDDLIETFGLQNCLASRFAKLSLGQQNRTNLARYLLQDFDLLIMDESLANVDEVTKETIVLKMKALFPERGFLYISHSVAEVAKFSEAIVVLRSHRKSPQAIVLRGQNHREGRELDTESYEQTMLEMVNAL
jgi:ABC-type nitrate/sulfonate/bicarbonate transport system ATPase subunit